MEAELEYNDQTFSMNNIFKKSVGGILSDPTLPVCQKENCIY